MVLEQQLGKLTQLFVLIFQRTKLDSKKKNAENICFIEDLALMIHILQKLSLLPLALYSQDVTPVTADHLSEGV
jgi:hypothetical protein